MATHPDAARRFHHHAVLDVSRPRQRWPGPAAVPRRRRQSDQRILQHRFFRPAQRQATIDHPAGRRFARAFRHRPAADREQSPLRVSFPGVQLSLSAHARVACDDRAQFPPRSVLGTHAALRQSAERRLVHADDRELDDQSTAGFRDRAAALDRRADRRRRRGQLRGTGRSHSPQRGAGRRGGRAELVLATISAQGPKAACCSSPPIALRRRNSTCGESSARLPHPGQASRRNSQTTRQGRQSARDLASRFGRCP